MIATIKDKLYLNNQLYLQQYCIGPSGMYYTGEVFNPLYSTKLTKDNIATVQTSLTQYTQYLPSPTTADYDKGYIYRYFAKNKVSNQHTIIQINKYQYDNVKLSLYLTFNLKWYISGQSAAAVYSNNRYTVQNFTQQPTIKYKLSNYLQFYKTIKQYTNNIINGTQPKQIYKLLKYYNQFGFRILSPSTSNYGCSLYNFIHRNYIFKDFDGESQIGLKTGIKLKSKQFTYVNNNKTATFKSKQYCLIGIQTNTYKQYILNQILLITKIDNVEHNNIILLYIKAQYVESFPYLTTSKIDLKIYGKGDYITISTILYDIIKIPAIQLSDLIQILQNLQKDVIKIQGSIIKDWRVD